MTLSRPSANSSPNIKSRKRRTDELFFSENNYSAVRQIHSPEPAANACPKPVFVLPHILLTLP
jgi:hypothetical protein